MVFFLSGGGSRNNFFNAHSLVCGKTGRIELGFNPKTDFFQFFLICAGRSIVGADQLADALRERNRDHHLIPGAADDFGALDAAGDAENRFAAFLGKVNGAFAEFHARAFGAVGNDADGGAFLQGFQ